MNNTIRVNMSLSKSPAVSIGSLSKIYEKKCSLGEGGFGVVCQYFDPVKQRYVATKQYSDKSKQAEYGEHEVKMLKLMQGATNVLQLYDVHRKDGQITIITEFLPMPLTAEMVKDPQDGLRIMGEIAHGLQEIHAKGYVHRDLKPNNIMLTETGVAKIIDLGLMERANKADGWAGTPGYANMRSPKNATFASDIFSLGATFHKLLFGISLGENKKTQQEKFNKFVKHVQGMPDSLERQYHALVLSCLVFDETKRPTTQQLLKEIARLRSGETVSAKALPASHKTTKTEEAQYIVVEAPLGYNNNIDDHEVHYCPNYKCVRKLVINRIEDYLNDDDRIEWEIDENDLQTLDENDLFDAALGLTENLKVLDRSDDYGITCIIKILENKQLKFYGKVRKYKK